MISIQIGDSSRDYESIQTIEEGWVLQQITERRRRGESFGVRVRINQTPFALALATPMASSGGGGGSRPPSPEENRVFTLWRECGLDSDQFAPGRLIEFLKRVANLLR
jgi:hypothetical protein